MMDREGERALVLRGERADPPIQPVAALNHLILPSGPLCQLAFFDQCECCSCCSSRPPSFGMIRISTWGIPHRNPITGLTGYFSVATQTLSADANSTPATSVVIVTDCRPAFLPGLTSNVSTY